MPQGIGPMVHEANAMKLPDCPKPLPPDLDREIKCLADLWAKHPARPRLTPGVAQHWDKLIEEWSKCADLPLLIRKEEKGIARGEEIQHVSGRMLVSTDNSAASWSFMLAFAGSKPNLQDVRGFLERDQIPVAMIVDREMKDRSRYKCSRVLMPSPNKAGWKVCHKRKVALRGRGQLRGRKIEDLQSHFRDFLSPSNMFLVPLALGGLGELPHFIAAITND